MLFCNILKKHKIMALKIEELWNKRLNYDILDEELFEDTCDFFSQKLPEETFEEYDIEELITEVIGHNESAKNFDKVIRFVEIIKEYQTDLYKKNFQYWVVYLVHYYCFKGDVEKIKEYFGLFVENPLADYDRYVELLFVILYYGYGNIVEEAMEKTFPEIIKDDELSNGDYNFSLANAKFYLELEKFYGKQNFKNDDIKGVAEKYKLNFKDKLWEILEQGMNSALIVENLKSDLEQNFEKTIFLIKIHFLKYMKKRGISFASAQLIWNDFTTYWAKTNKSKNPDTFFNVRAKSLFKHLDDLHIYLFADNLGHILASTWGGFYVYDFLKEIELISQKVYDYAMKELKILKGAKLRSNIKFLWESNFVHKWQKADSVSENEFIEEEKIFIKSSTFRKNNFQKVESELETELKNIGELANYIKDTRKLPEAHRYEFSSKKMNEIKSKNHEVIVNENNNPIVKDKKTGRNDPCPCYTETFKTIIHS